MSAQAPPSKVDRQTTTPFLLRLFYKTGSYHRLDEFDPSARLPPHLQIYTWPTCTLSELTHLLITALPSLLPPSYAGTRIAYRLVYGDMSAPNRPGVPGRFISRELGSVVVGASAGRDGYGDVETGGGEDVVDIKEALKQLDGDPDKSLGDAKFVIGDYISCAILPPLPDGSVAAAPPPPAGPSRDGFGGGRGRENGFAGRGDFGGYGGRGRGGGRFEDRRGSGGVPSGEWRRGEAPPERDGYWRGGGGRARGRGRW